jgi:hypothetical protein
MKKVIKDTKRTKKDDRKAASPKDLPENVKDLIALIGKIKELDSLAAVSKAIRAQMKALGQELAAGFQMGDKVWFKMGERVLAGKVAKVKSNGTVKIMVGKRNHRITGNLVSKGEPPKTEVTGKDTQEEKKAA